MSSTFDMSRRQVVPRWLTYPASIALRLLKAHDVSTHSKPTVDPADSALGRWRGGHDVGTAIDLVAESVVLRKYTDLDALEAAQFLLAHAPLPRPEVLGLAQHYISQPPPHSIDVEVPPSPSALRREIGRLRARTRFAPWDAIAWSDLALHYAIAGGHDSALRAMRAAVHLGPHNRFVLRSAARCYLHFGEPDRALHVLRGSPMCNRDPWVISAEIAVSETAGLRSRLLRPGRILVSDDNLSWLSRSELAAAISTLEFSGGGARKAKSLMRSALREPTENAAAQAEWLASHLAHAPTATPGDVPASYEAQTQYQFHQQQYEESIGSAVRWTALEPLSSRPLVHASFISSVALNDDLRTIALLEGSRLARLADPVVTNNLVFALLRAGRIEDASALWKRVDRRTLSPREILVTSATEGMFSFRIGDAVRGRQLYASATAGFERARDLRGAAIAQCFWALEEGRVGSDESRRLASLALGSIDKWNLHELSIYRTELAAIAAR